MKNQEFFNPLLWRFTSNREVFCNRYLSLMKIVWLWWQLINIYRIVSKTSGFFTETLQYKSDLCLFLKTYSLCCGSSLMIIDGVVLGDLEMFSIFGFLLESPLLAKLWNGNDHKDVRHIDRLVKREEKDKSVLLKGRLWRWTWFF